MTYESYFNKYNSRVRRGLSVLVPIAVCIYVAQCAITTARGSGIFAWEYRLTDDDDELIDYSLKQGEFEIASHHDRYRSEVGQRSTALGLNGRPDRLSVTWRNKRSGRRFNSDVDLLPLLPKGGIDGGDLGFEIANDRLTVYVVTTTYSGGGTTGRPYEVHPTKTIVFRSDSTG